MAVSKTEVWQRKLFQIGAGLTVDIDYCPFLQMQHIEYIIHFKNDTNTDSKSLNMSVKKSDINVQETVASLLGKLDVIIAPQVVGADYVLRITNNESFAVNGSFAKAFL